MASDDLETPSERAEFIEYKAKFGLTEPVLQTEWEAQRGN